MQNFFLPQTKTKRPTDKPIFVITEARCSFKENKENGIGDETGKLN